MDLTFRKPKARQLRKRDESEQPEEDTAIPSSSAVNTPTPSIKRPTSTPGTPVTSKAAPSGPARVLSFADDDEETETSDVVVLKKSAASKRMSAGGAAAALQIPALSTPPPAAASESSARSYSSEALRALRASTPVRLSASKDDDESANNGRIPDAATIHAMRKRREQLRKLKSMNVIPLEDVDPDDKYSGRLQREEDEMDDGDIDDAADGSTVAFGTQSAQKAARDRRKAIKDTLELDPLAVSDEDNSDAEWEETLIRRGAITEEALKPLQQATSDGSVLGNAIEEARRSASIVNAAQALKIPAVGTLPQVSDVQMSLERALRDARQQHERHSAHLKAAREQAANGERVQAEIRQKMAATSAHLAYYRQIRDYLETLGECLDEKMRALSTHEDTMLRLDVERTRAAVERRESQHARFMAEVDAAMRCVVAPEAAESAAAALPSDDNSDADNEGVAEEAEEETLQAAARLFDDVPDDLRDVTVVRARLEAWKHQTTDTVYSDSYVALSLRDVFAPFVRYETIAWRPLRTHVAFESMAWFSALDGYGTGGAAAVEPAEEELIQRLLERVLLPKLTACVTYALDVISVRQNMRALQALEQLMDYDVSKERDGYKALVAAVAQRLGDAVEAVMRTSAVTIPQRLDDARLVALYNAAQQRIFWRAFRLFRVVLLWHRHLPQDTVTQLAYDRLAQHVLLPAMARLETGGVQAPVGLEAAGMLERIVASTPNRLLSGAADAVPAFLRPIEEKAVQMSERVAMGGPDAEAALARIAEVLAKLKSFEAAASISMKMAASRL